MAGVNESAVGDAARALAEADVVVETHLTYPRVTGVPIEGRAVLAAQDAESGRLTVWSSTQVPFNVRTAIADALGLPEARSGSSPPTSAVDSASRVTSIPRRC